MKARMLKPICILLFISMLWTAITVNAKTESNPLSESFGMEEREYFAKYNTLVTLKGVFGTSDFHFNVDKNWDVKAVTLFLHITQSQLIDPDFMSTMAISLNGEPVYSLKLTEYMTNPSVIELNLDVRKIKKGINSIKVQVYRRISSKPCTDDVSNANWLNIHEHSGVKIVYTDRKPSLKISQFPYPFYKVQQERNLDTAIVLPDHPNETELACALEMASYLGKHAGVNDILFDTVLLSSVSGNYNKNVIFISTFQNMPFELLAHLPKDTDLSNGAALKLIPSPYGSDRVMLLVTAENDSDLIRAVKLLGNESLVSQIDTDYYYLDQTVDILTKDEPQEPSLTFSQLGYHGIYVSGMFRQKADMALKIPKNRIIDENTTITIHFRYSENLDFDRSLFTIYINDVPSGSKKLRIENASDDRLTITIPKEARKGNYLNLRFAFDLEIKDAWCTFRQDEMPWAYIIEDSSIYLSTQQNTVNLFESFPNPFIRDNQWNNTVFVFPQDFHSYDLRLAGIVAAMIGRELKSNHGTVTAVYDFTKQDLFMASNLIVIGSPQRQEIIRINNDHLFYQYEPDFQYFVSNEKIELLPEYSKDLVSFQLIDSPYNIKTAMLILTAPDESKLQNHIETLFQPSEFSKLIGDGALIDNGDTIINHRFKKDTLERPEFWPQNEHNIRTFAVVFGLSMFMILLTLILFIRKKRNYMVM